jgi:hypothetical protein
MKGPFIGVGPHVTIQLTIKIIIFMLNFPFILFYHILKWIYFSTSIHVEVTRLVCSNWNQTWHVSNMNREIDFHDYWMDEINFTYFVFYIQHGIISIYFQHDSDFFFTMEDFITMWMFNFITWFNQNWLHNFTFKLNKESTLFKSCLYAHLMF